MTKNEIIQQLAAQSGLTVSQATHAVDGIIGILADALASGNPVTLRGFGTIKTVQRAAKTARNIHTGEFIHLPPCRRAKFIAYKQLQARIDEHEHQ